MLIGYDEDEDFEEALSHPNRQALAA